MEADDLTLSQKREHFERLAAVGIPDAEDISQKLSMARKIYWMFPVCMPPRVKKKVLHTNALKYKAMRLTGTDEGTVNAAATVARRRTKFFNFVSDNVSVPERDLDCLRDIIMKLYLEKRIVPTLQDIIEENTVCEPKLLSEYTSDLKSLGYMWRKLPGTTASVIVEDPEQLHSRIHYLERIMEYRRTGRSIVYVRYVHRNSESMVNVALQNGTYLGQFLYLAIAASPHLGLLKRTCYDSHRSILDKWFRHILLPSLPKSCVVVIDSNATISSLVNVPTSGSSKSEMISWLEAENIPHNPSWHRAELYKLLEIYKRRNVEGLGTLGEYTKTWGHKFLTLPKAFPSLNYFKNIKDSQMKTMKPEEWIEHDNQLAERELKVYEDSIKFDKIIDQLFTMATYEDVREMSKNLDRYHSSDKKDNFNGIVFN